MKANNLGKRERLHELFRLAVVNGIVESKGDFADFIGITFPTLSNALQGRDDRVNMSNVVIKAENALRSKGVDITNSLNTAEEGASQIFGNNNAVGVPQKKFDHEDGWFGIIAAKDRQIETLLSQQSEFLRLSASLTQQNQKLIEKLTK